MAELTPIDQLKLQTRPYCVHIADEIGVSLGSGLLYYPGEGPKMYVFTCAHVVWQAKLLTIHILLPENPDQDEYRTCQLTAFADQVRYSPLDQTEQGPSGETFHSHDIAVIALPKEGDLRLPPTEYFVAEAQHYMSIYMQGYPGGWCRETEEQLEALDCSSGSILTAIGEKPTFGFRVEDTFLDPGNRAYELKGFSGAPIWDADGSEHSVLGLTAVGKRSSVFRGRIDAVKMRFVQSIMKNEFGIYLETKIPGIPEEEIADKCTSHCNVNPACFPAENMPQDAWASAQEKKLRALIDDLKMQQAIDLGRGLIDDPQYRSCSKECRYRLMKHLMYCYNTCILEAEAHALELQMRREGLIETHDNGQWMTNLFGMQKYEELLQFTEDLPETDKDHPLGKFLGTMARAFVHDSPPDQTVGLYVDEKERLRNSPEDIDAEALYLQVIGFVYIACYQMPEKAIRCLNLSYRLNGQSIVLETLGCAYYQLALKNALNESGQIQLFRINHAHLYKARSCFLILMEKEDKLCFCGAIKRMGWQIFHTFVFLQDSYRVLQLYPWMCDHFPFQKTEDRREVEKYYADVVAQSGKIDLAEFSALTEDDKLLFRTAADINHFAARSSGYLEASAKPELERELQALISNVKKCVEQLDVKAALSIRRALIRLYYNGARLFGWNTLPEIKQHYQLITDLLDQRAAAETEELIFELEHTYEENVRHFQEAYEKAPSFQTWNALTWIHIRFGAFDIADERYLELFREHEELYREEPEYIYRACLDYVKEYHRDLKIALRCYLDSTNRFDDKDILGFWELELMLMTCTFNEPERFEEERRHFFEQKLIGPDAHYGNSLLAYTENLNESKASKMFQHLPPSNGLTREAAFYLAWQKRLRPLPDERRNEFAPRKIEGLLKQYEGEDWNWAAGKEYLLDRFKIERTCCVDAWTLYLLAESRNLIALEDMDMIYIPHCTIDHMLFEISQYPNEAVHRALEHIESHENIHIHSADFVHQLKVRDKALYDEPAGVVAAAMEKDCLAVIGAPFVNELLINAFSGRMVRPTDIFALI